MALNFTLLTKEQIWGDSALDAIEKYGGATSSTDLGILLGGMDGYERNCTSEGEKAFWTWTKTPTSVGHCVRVVTPEGNMAKAGLSDRHMLVRPVISPEEATKIILPSPKKQINGIDVIEYGEYPQTVVDEKTRAELEDLYQESCLQITGKSYTFDGSWKGSGKSFDPRVCFEYEHDGKKYIRLQPIGGDNRTRLSNGNKFVPGRYWVRVDPIEWLVDKSGALISKKGLFSGIQFDTNKRYDGDFENTFMKYYLDNHFAKEIIPVEQQKIIQGLKSRLTEISDLENIKKTITPAATPERTETLARITRVRRAKEVLSSAARQAKKSCDGEILQEVIEIAKPYAARDAVIRDKFHMKRLERRAKNDRG